MKRRRMNVFDCMKFEATAEGMAALRHPNQVKTESKDRSYGLYPREKQSCQNKPKNDAKKPFFRGFVSAREFQSPSLPFRSEFENYDIACSSENSQSPKKKHRTEQANTILNYLSIEERHRSTAQLTNTAKEDNSFPNQSNHVRALTFTNCLSAQKLSAKNKILKVQGLDLSSPVSPNLIDDINYVCDEEASFDPLHFVPLEESHQPSFFHRLPPEILEKVFAGLPIRDLYLCVRLVCKAWNAVISQDLFIPWKKKYFQLKLKQEKAEKFMTQIFVEWKMTCYERYLMGIIEYMNDYKPADIDLSGHPLFRMAQALIKERFPSLMANSWTIFAAIVILSSSVHHISLIFEKIRSNENSCRGRSSVQIIDALYCMACFLLVMSRARRGPWSSLHYQLYYALYLLESKYDATVGDLLPAMNNSGQQCISRYQHLGNRVQLTHEQMRICRHDLKEGECVKIIAFAGTGKTSTLRAYTQLRPGLRFLLIVFNKDVQLQNEKTFPSNVDCKTGHALAYHTTGVRYRNKLGGDIRLSELERIVKVIKGEGMYTQLHLVLVSLKSFLSSDDDIVTTAHVPFFKDEMHESGEKVKVEIEHRMRVHYAKEAEMLWNKMIDFYDKDICMTHDGYLKKFQLSHPTFTQYDVIFVDEAQDITPCLHSILRNQKQPIVFVGDPHQQIYSFRGAVNALDQIQASHVFYLTQSFRFGSKIAQTAQSILEACKGLTEKTLVGNSSNGTIDGTKRGQLAVLCRSNLGVFQCATKYFAADCATRSVAIAGGLKALKLEAIEQLYIKFVDPKHVAVYNNASARQFQKFLGKFQHLNEVEKHAMTVKDNDLMSSVKIINLYRQTLPAHITNILKKIVHDMDFAEVVLSTVHKSKGLEFHSVKIMEDFAPTEFHRHAIFSSHDEANLLYVAVTRAKYHLVINSVLNLILQVAGERFLSPAHSSDLLCDESAQLRCVLTHEQFAPRAVTLVQEKIVQGTGNKQNAGPVCPSKITESFREYAYLFGTPEKKSPDST